MDKEIVSSKTILKGAGVSVLDAARFAKNILDAKPIGSALSDAQFILKVIETGLRHFRAKEMAFADGFAQYLQSKSHLSKDSIRDIRCIGNRLIKVSPELATRNFSELSAADCESWLALAFATSPQFNKGRAMLHALFEFSLRRGWCDKNPIKLIFRRKIIEKEIMPLNLEEARRLIRTAQKHGFAAPAGLLMYAGIRPREVRRLFWSDIDIAEKTITVRAQCSKTGGIRQVEICPALLKILQKSGNEADAPVCPRNWDKHWRKIRDASGFKGHWVQDVLRHTYASYHAKRYRDLPRLQLNMGHRDLCLLRSRYINMRGISNPQANTFFI